MKIQDFTVEKIKSSVGRDFIKDNHYTGSCHNGPMVWGLLYEDELIGACAFATPISENVRKYIWKDEVEDEMKNHVTELHRLYTVDEAPRNTESWFVTRALDGLVEYKPKYKAVISLADSTEGHTGTIYQALNGIYYGTADERVFYRDGDGNLRSPRQGGENVTLQDAKDRGWEIERRGVKHRYLFVLDDSVRDKIDVPEMEYPEPVN